jgi:hypothetical protein
LTACFAICQGRRCAALGRGDTSEDAGMGRVIEFRQKPTTRQVEQAGIAAERAVRLAIRLYRAKYGCSLADVRRRLLVRLGVGPKEPA